MAWIYGESPAPEQRRMQAHLEACASCRRQVEAWRGAGALLDADTAAWRRPARSSPRFTPGPVVVRWAAAAALVAAGFLAGASSGVPQSRLDRSLAAAKTSWEAESRRRREEDLQSMASAAAAISARQSEAVATRILQAVQASEERNRGLITAALETIEADRAAQSVSYESALRDLARRTGAGFHETRNDLNLLASLLPSGRTAPREAGDTKAP